MENINGFTSSEHKERRHFPRLSASVDIEYSLLAKQAEQEEKTVTKNISAGGICLIVYERIEIGTLLALKLHLTDIGHTIKAKGRVIWSSYFTVGPDGQDRYDLGIEFVEIDEADRQKLSKYIFRYEGA